MSDDPTRKAYRALSESETNAILDMKDLGDAFIKACDTAGSSRELTLAKTNMEQAVMWAVKGITASE